MVELVFIVCLLAQPEQCSEERPSFQEPFPSTVACARSGYLRAVEWELSHPRWGVRRWSCELPST